VRRAVVARVRARGARVRSVTAMAEPEILLDRVTKRFATGRSGARSGSGDGTAPLGLDRVTLSVERGELVVVVGPSGCGKSTTLRLVAGLDEPDDGAVVLAGRPMRGVPPQDRDVAMVFQGYALYPHMTVREIMEFPLKMRGATRDVRDGAVREAAAMLRIEPLLERRPGELSGGERQRVAMGRAIVRKPRVFLFDEPLSNLDTALRADLRLEIGRLVRRLGVTALYVTHDHVEAMTLADRVAVMQAGRIVQIGTPREVYERPATSFVGSFLGSPRMNLLPAHVDRDVVVAGPFRVPRPPGELPAALELGVRPEHVRVERELPGIAGHRGEVIAAEPLGAETHLLVRLAPVEGLDGVELRAQVRSGFDAPGRGVSVRVSIDERRALVFAASGKLVQ
jgi:multiple sugar transport system ATP-binding protein